MKNISLDKATQVFHIDVAWGDSDILGHTNNVQFIRYLESARVAYCEEVMGLPLELGMSAGWVLADMQCSYLQQVHYPTHLDVYSSISRIGGKSVTLMADLFRKGEDEPVARSQAVMVWFDFDAKKSAAIPEKIRQLIADYEHVVEQQ